MMRWLFAVLVLVNLGFLMWASWFRDSPDEAVAARPLFHPELMVPLKTSPAALKARKTERNEAPLAAAKPRPRCVTFGPLADADAGKAAAWLNDEKIAGTRRSESRKVDSAFWVYLSPYATRKEAEARRRELERLGFREHLIMKDSEGRIAVSLGLYSSAENAEHRIQELAKKGISARREVRQKDESVNYFDLRLVEPADEAFARLRAQAWGSTAVEVRDASCVPESGG
ncbi:MAG: SPOR domain-containing protein [Gammaproteobacteria bacterium]|nr:SPOR domain-containing protein [Gammaproteobacteria bacterium]